LRLRHAKVVQSPAAAGLRGSPAACCDHDHAARRLNGG
jgi:hypothetical protein